MESKKKRTGKTKSHHPDCYFFPFIFTKKKRQPQKMPMQKCADATIVDSPFRTQEKKHISTI